MIHVTHCEGIRTDNEYYYLDYLRSHIAYSDGDAEISFHKTPEEIILHVTPSHADFKQDIIDNLLMANRQLGMKITFSKSLALSKKVSYSIKL